MSTECLKLIIRIIRRRERVDKSVTFQQWHKHRKDNEIFLSVLEVKVEPFGLKEISRSIISNSFQR